MENRPFYETSYKRELPKCDVSPLPIKKIDRKPCEICGSSQEHETCSKCNTLVHIGMWQWCKGNPEDHGKIKHYGFEVYCDEHILPNGKDYSVNLYGERVHGTWIGSRSERQAIMKANGIISAGKINRKQSSKMDFDGRSERIAKEALETWKKDR